MVALPYLLGKKWIYAKPLHPLVMKSWSERKKIYGIKKTVFALEMK